ncbi:MAG: TetR/AcrR family transcriptional regulator [Pseudomonadota bacterium]
MTWNNGEYQPRQKRAEEKKGLILDAALELFSAHGFHGTTAKAIAAGAGVATGSFYRYFRDKKAVFIAVCLRIEEDLGGRLFAFGQQMRSEGRSEREVLASLAGFTVLAHRRHKAFHREVLAMQLMDPDVAVWGGEREARLLAALLAFIRPMCAHYRVRDLEAATELVYYAIEEVAHRAVIFDSPVGDERLIRELEDMLSRYLFE